jgi:6-phosphogluconolactonase
MRALPPQAPPRFEIRILANAREAARAAAQEVAGAAADAIADRDVFRVAFSGGTTPARLFDTLATPRFRRRIDWGRTRVFFVDERCVPPSHERSNYRLAREHLLDPLRVPPANVFRMRGEDEPRRAAATYEKILRQEFGVRTPRFDLVLLGLGADGHTASLFPESPALAEKTRWVVSVAPNPGPSPGERRLTLTLPVLNAGRRVDFLVAGKDKAGVVATVLGKKPGYRKLPASRVSAKRGSLIWILDDSSAAQM